MKKRAIILGLLLLASCSKEVVQKPDNLIARDKMVDIICDLSLLEAMRSQKPILLEQNGINQNTYVYKKYGIDSVQFAKSNQYYAADIEGYKKIYKEVAERLDSKKGNTPAPANNDAGIVR